MHDERRLPDRYRPVIVPSGRYCAQDSELGELVVRHVELCEHCVHGEVPISGYDYYYKTDLTRPSPRLVPMAAAVARRVAFVISSLPPLSFLLSSPSFVALSFLSLLTLTLTLSLFSMGDLCASFARPSQMDLKLGTCNKAKVRSVSVCSVECGCVECGVWSVSV